MKIQTVIVDDEKDSRRAILAALRQYPEIEVIGEAENANELITILQNQQVDFAFLDIELAEESGFDVAEYLRKNYPEIVFAFLTGHASYAVDGYEFGAASFFTKPINYVKFDRSIQRIKKQILEKKQGNEPKKHSENAKLMLRCGTGYEIVSVEDIIYIERRCRKNYVVTGEGEKRIYSYSIKDLVAMLEPYHFYCSHQSYIVPLNRIEAIRDEEKQLYYLKLRGSDKKIPLSRTKYEECRQLLKDISIQVI